jgi:hypothetical protein
MPIENFEGEIIVSNAKVRIFSERVSGLSLTLDQIEERFRFGEALGRERFPVEKLVCPKRFQKWG